MPLFERPRDVNVDVSGIPDLNPGDANYFEDAERLAKQAKEDDEKAAGAAPEHTLESSLPEATEQPGTGTETTKDE